VIPSVRVAGSDVSITRIGFGCARIFGGSEAKASRRLIETALTCGIRHFDTAPSYGDGSSEKVLGDVLRGVQEATITTKIGIPRPNRRAQGPYSWPVIYRKVARPTLSQFPKLKRRLLSLIEHRAAMPNTAERPHRQLDRDDILRELDESLKRLRRTRIDLYLIHEPDQIDLTDDLKEIFAKLCTEGIIGAFGLGWGGDANVFHRFGTVVQGTYYPTSRGIQGTTRIFHGVLRHAEEETIGNREAGTRIREVLRLNSDAAVLFSASTRWQIESVACE
jgi:aryl-alcohol dehydrogenase-like predicted oxidoreductase